MDSMNGSRVRGTGLAGIGFVVAGALASGLVFAETIFTVNGVDVDSTVVDIYFESRLAQQGGQATPEQREALMTELRDIYILSTQESATYENQPDKDHLNRVSPLFRLDPSHAFTGDSSGRWHTGRRAEISLESYCS